MKNLKAILFIILGSFFIATGFAFAGPAYDGLKSSPFKSTGNGGYIDVTPKSANSHIKAVEEPKPEPSLGQKMNKWVDMVNSDHFDLRGQ